MKKIIFITGASSGIGRAIGDYLLHKNCIVYGTSRNPQKVNGTLFPLLEVDVRDVVSIENAIKHIISIEGRIDVLINNAGVGMTGALEEIPLEEIRNNFETNFYGPISVIKAVLPQMRAQQSGLIINITSISAYMGLPYRSVYSASKSALSITAEALRMETKQFGINIVNIAPGDFATNIAAGRYHAPIIKDSVYEMSYKNTLDLMDSGVNSGSSTDIMGHLVYDIMQNPKPKVNYKIGSFLQKFSIVLKRILPDNMFEKMLMNHYKL